LLHFEFINKAARKYDQLKKPSQLNHNPAILSYLASEIGEPLPIPAYENLGYQNRQQTLSDLKLDKLIENVSEQIIAIQEIEQFRDSYKNLQETSREAVVQSRIGQGEFRAALIKYWKGCSVSNCKQIELLRASHIKPWRLSSNEERLDLYNGLLLVPNLDICFDLGFISFDNDGKILISSKMDEVTLFQLGISRSMKLVHLEKRHMEFLRFHRENIFQR
jgi:putative restriction endonuclease